MKRPRDDYRKTQKAKRIQKMGKPATFRTSNLPAYNMNMSKRGELKCCDTFLASTTFQNVAVVPVLLNAIVNGASIFQRVGNKLNMKSIRVRGVIRNTATAIQDTGRIVIVYDRQANGSLPAFSDMFQTVNNAGTTETTGLSEININNRDRFIILRDKQIVLPAVTFTAGVLTNFGPNNANDGEENELIIDEFIKLKGLQSTYRSAGGGIADIASGSLFMYFLSQQDTAKWTATYTTRLRYYD